MKSFEQENRFQVVYTQGGMLDILLDRQTGVQYLFYNSGLTPLLERHQPAEEKQAAITE